MTFSDSSLLSVNAIGEEKGEKDQAGIGVKLKQNIGTWTMAADDDRLYDISNKDEKWKKCRISPWMGHKTT